MYELYRVEQRTEYCSTSACISGASTFTFIQNLVFLLRKERSNETDYAK
jgi:hypothetical protein